MKQPSVDVIIPTYNGLPYLKEAAKSVLTQTYRELTLYVVDDGSTDNGATAKYVKGLEDPRVKYIYKTNGGQATARNLGVASSHADLITFLDSDDLMHPDKIARQLEVMSKNPTIGMVYGWCRLIDGSNNIFGRGSVVWRKRGRIFKPLLIRQKIPGSASMVMIRREVFDRVGLFHEDFLIGEDWEMWLRIARDYEIDYVPDFLVGIRVLDTGMQQNHLKIASGLDYMLPIMVKEFKLGLLSRAIIGTTCLRQACILYFKGGDRKSARRAFYKMLAYNPLAIFFIKPRDWLICVRFLFGNRWLRSIRRKLSASYRQRESELTDESSVRES